jgi:hypothetical protein
MADDGAPHSQSSSDTIAEALRLTLALTPSSRGQETAEREITTALENALDARRQRPFRDLRI